MSDANRIDIIISAQTAELMAGMDQAVSHVDGSVGQIAERLHDIAESAKEAAGNTGIGALTSAITALGEVSGLSELAEGVARIGEVSVQAAEKIEAIERNLKASGLAGADLEHTVDVIKEIRDNSNFSADEIARVVQHARALGPVSDESMKMAANAAAGAGKSFGEVAQMFARIEQGGQGAARSSMMLERQLGITSGMLKAAGAELDAHGHALSNTAEQAEKLRVALQRIVENKYPDAAKTAQGSSAALSAAMTELEENIGKAAAEIEAAGRRILVSLVKTLDKDLPDSVKATIGVLGDLGGTMAGFAGQGAQMAATLGQAYLAYTMLVTARERAAAASAVEVQAAGASVAAQEAEVSALLEKGLAEADVAAANLEEAAANRAAMNSLLEQAAADDVASESLLHLASAAEASAIEMAEYAAEVEAVSAAHLRMALAVDGSAGALVGDSAAVDALTASEVYAAFTTLDLTAEMGFFATAAATAAAAATAVGAAIAAMAIPITAMGAAAMVAASYIGMLDNTILDLKAAANWWLGTNFKSMGDEAREAQEAISAGNRVLIADLEKHSNLVGATAEQYRALGLGAKDATNIVIDLRAKLDEAKSSRGAEAGILAELQIALKARTDLAGSEVKYADAVKDTHAKLLEVEHAHKMNEASIQDVNAARKADIATMEANYAAMSKEKQIGKEGLDQLRQINAAKESGYSGEQKAIKETMQLVEARHKLGQASDADQIRGMEAEIASMRAAHATTLELMALEAKLHSARVKQIDELLAKQNDATKASQKLHEDAAVASIAATTAQYIATSHSNTAAAQDEVALAKFVLASKQATNEATSTEVDNVAHAEIALARATRDERVQAAQDEVAKVQQAEADKVANAREALAEVQHGIAERAKLGKANADEERKNQLELQKASEALTLAKQEGFEAVTAAQQKSTDAQAVAEHELTVKTIEEANKRKLAELSAIEEIKVAMLGQAKTQAEIKAQSLEGAVEKGVAGFKGGKVTKEDLKTISDEFLAAKQQQADAEYDIEIEAMRKIAKKWKEARQDTSQYEATQEKIATEHRLNTEIQAIDALLGKLKGLEGGPEMKSLQGQLDKLKAERGQLEGISAPVQAAEQAADKAGDALEGMAKAIVKTTEAAKAAKDENDKNFFDDPKHKSLGLFGGASSIFAEQPNVAAGGGVGAAGGGGGQGTNRFAFGWDPSLAQPPSVYTPAQANASAQGLGGGSPSGVTPWGVGVGNPSGLPQYDPGTANAPMYNGGHPMDSRTVPSTGNMPGSKTVGEGGGNTTITNHYTFNGFDISGDMTFKDAADKAHNDSASSPAQNLDGTVGRYRQ